MVDGVSLRSLAAIAAGSRSEILFEPSPVDETAKRIVTEGRGDEAAVPIRSGGGKTRGDFRMRGGNVASFSEVRGEIIKLRCVLIGA
jgi:hypothetical protein